MKLSTAISVLCLTTLSTASPARRHLRARQIYQFPDNNPLESPENIAVRSDGKLIVTLSSSSSIYLFDPTPRPPTHPSSPPEVLFTIPNTTSSLGIAEFAPNKFAIATGNFTASKLYPIAHSFSIWQGDFNVDPPCFTKITDIPEAGGLNGVTTSTGGFSDDIFIADSFLGAIWKLNVKTGRYRIVMRSPYFRQADKKELEKGITTFGINGVHVHDNKTLYFSSSAQRVLGKIALDTAGTGDPKPESLEILARPPKGYLYDDFALGRDGKVFAAVHSASVLEIDTDTKHGRTRNLTMEMTKDVRFVQPTSLVFGGERGRDCLMYVTDAGQQEGDIVENGRILEIDLC